MLLAAPGLLAAESTLSPARRPTLQSVTDFWNLPGEQRNEAHPIRYDIWVTFVDPQWRNFWFTSGGYPGYLPLSTNPPALRAGQRVLLTGTVIPNVGLAADTANVTPLDQSYPPAPLSIAGQVGDVWQFDQKLVTADAYVDQQLLVDANHLRLYLIVENRPVIGWVWLSKPAEIPNLAGNFVQLSGVYSARADPSGTTTDIELWAAGLQNIKIGGPISRDPRFNREITPINLIFKTAPGTEIVIRGRVQSQVTGSHIVVRDETGQVVVHTIQEQRLAMGTEVEVAGRTSPFGTAWTLHPGLFRVIGPPAAITKSASSSEPLRLIEQIRQLSTQDAATGKRVSLMGVVTWSQPDQSYLFLHDVSGGIRVRFDPKKHHAPGITKSVSIEGVTYQGPLGPAVQLNALREISAMRLPQHKSVTLDQAITGSEDGQSVEMRGYLQGFEVRDNRTWMELITPTGAFRACIQTPEDLSGMQNALIRMRGVCDTETDEQGRVTGVMLWIPYLHSLSIEEDAPADLFDVPLRSITDARQLSAAHSIRRIRIAGTVTHHVPGDHLYVQENGASLLVLSGDDIPLVPGDTVEAVGLLGRESKRTVLRAGTYRKTGRSEAPQPLVVENVDRSMESLDGQLVTVRGTLVNAFRQLDGTRLSLQSGKTIFDATLRPVDGHQLSSDLALESGLEVTGILQASRDGSKEGRGFEMEVRSEADLRVVRKPRVLTLQRAINVAAVLGGLIMLGLIWVSALRRRVHRQMNQIRSQLEREVQLEDRHRGIVENASDFIFTTDLEGRFTSFNPAGERMTGFTQEQAFKLQLRDLILPDTSTEVLLEPGQLPAERTVTFQGKLRTSDGDRIWIETSSRLVTSAGKPVGLLGIVRDISERKEIEEEMKRARDAAEANTRAKSEFLANMSHEIRTPMNAVIGMSNLLLDTSLDERQRDFAETIRNGAEALLTVLNDILDFSKIEAGRLQIESVDFDLREVLENTVGLLASRAADKGLELAMLVPTDLPCTLRGDPSRLRQVVLNMLGNAVKFTERGEVFLNVTRESESPESVVYRFEFTDTGVGISPEEQARLFRPFSQADTSTTRRFGGTGLGLAISKQIVELMNGECGVRSQPGTGSTFWFTASFAIAGPNRLASEPLAASRRVRGLLVDANATSRRVIQHYASHCGLDLETCENARDALARLASAQAAGAPCEIMIVDDPLVESPPFHLIEAVRKVHGPGELRIVALTSPNRIFDPADLERFLIGSVCVKPVRYADLTGSVRRAYYRPKSEQPLALAASQPSRPPMRAALPLPEPRSSGPDSLRILVAEDNPVNQRVVLLQLQKLGHHADAVGNGIEALTALEKATYDVVLMDCQMPEMDGVEATRHIRKHSEWDHVRVIALTADAMHGAREKCAEAGMDDYLSKPIRIGDLQTALARHRRNAP